jgi:hypothetical protein
VVKQVLSWSYVVSLSPHNTQISTRYQWYNYDSMISVKCVDKFANLANYSQEINEEIMANIYYLNRPTKTYMAIARQQILTCYSLVKQGRDKEALKSANRAVEAFEKAVSLSTQPGHNYLFIPLRPQQQSGVSHVG